MQKEFSQFFEGYRSLLALNGTIPDTYFLNLPLIAADGAANTLVAKNIYPQLVVGDLDSILDDVRRACLCLHLPDQNRSDFEKALIVLKERDLLPAIVVGINGGFIDHIITNISIFAKTNCLFYDPPVIGLMLHAKQQRHFVLPFATKISMKAMPEATITIQGFKWDLEQEKLNFCGKNSCFNRTAQEGSAIYVHEGSLLIMIYLEIVQDEGTGDQTLKEIFD